MNATNYLDTQVLIHLAEDFSKMERYTLQPTKTEVLKVLPKNRQTTPIIDIFQIYDEDIANPTVSTHLGLKRGTTVHDTIAETVDNNIKKARRTAYSLMASGLHGENGIDAESSLHLLKAYVIPVLLYGLEILVPKGKHLTQLERFQKKILKQVLSVPSNTADAAI